MHDNGSQLNEKKKKNVVVINFAEGKRLSAFSISFALSFLLSCRKY